MTRAISYFVFSSNGAYLRWDDDLTIGFTIRQYQMSITGGSGVDRLYAGAGTQVDATGLFASAGVDQLYFSGSFSDYNTQSVSGSGVYTFTGMAGGTHAGEVISFSMTSSGDTLVFADRTGMVQLSSYLNLQTNSFATIQDSQLTAATQTVPALGAVPGNAASKVFVFDSGGINIPQLPIVGEAIAITGGSGIDSFYVRKGTNADATGLFASAGIDVLYLTGKFADYDQTVSTGGVYTFTRTFTAAADVELNELVSFSMTSSGDKLVFADGGATLQLSHYLSGGSFGMILATDLDRTTVTPGLHPAPTIASFTAVDAGGSNGATLGKAGETVTFAVTMSEAVTVTGTPTITFNVGTGASATTITASYTSGTGTSILTFTATTTIPAGANGTLSVASIAIPSGASVIGTVNTQPWVTATVGQTYAGYQIDTTAPSSIAISGTSGNVAENSVGAVTLTANPNNVAGESSTVTWSLGTGGDNSLFNLTSAGVLSFKVAPNFEMPHGMAPGGTGTNAYTVNVIATDAAGNASAASNVVVNVTDVNEAPTVTAQTPSQTAVVNQPFSVNVASAFSDPDSVNTYATGTPQWGTLTYTTSNNLPAGLSINATTGVISGTATAAASTATITVTATDGGTLSVTETFSLNVVAAPTIASFTAVDAGGTNGATLGKAGETVTFSVTMSEAVTVTTPSGGTAPSIVFNVGTGAGATAMTASYTGGTGTSILTFTATIPAGANGASLSVASISLGTSTVTGNTSTLAWTSTSVGQTYAGYQIDTAAPSSISTSAGATGTVAENTVGAVTLTANPNNVTGEPATLTWALGTGADNNLFTITSAGVLSFKPANTPNFEMPRGLAPSVTNTNAYTVNVTATDVAGNATTQAIVVNVTDVNEAPTVTAQTTAKTAVVNQPFSVNVSTAFSDPDSVNTYTAGTPQWGTLTYTTSNNLPAGLSINATTGVISGTPTATTASAATITVTATDGGSLSVTETFSLSVVSTPPFSAPVIASFTAVDAGNGNTATLGKAGETVTFSVTMSEAVTVTTPSGGTAPSIVFNVGTGAGATAMTASYTGGTGTNILTFTATIPAGANGASLSVASISLGTSTVTGNVSARSWLTTSVGQTYAGYQIDTTAPSSIGIAGTSGNVAENTTGAVTLTANANDVNANASVTWALGSGADTGLFNLTNGVLSFKNAPDYEMPRGRMPNIENTNAYTVNVIASDLAGNASTQALVVNVTNVNEAPTAIQLSSNRLVENTPTNNGIKVGNLLVIDPDSSGNNNVLSLTTGTDASHFEIRNGKELFYTGTTPSYATQSSYNLTIHSIDGNLSYNQDLHIQVANLSNPQLISVRSVDTGNIAGSTSDTFILTFDQAVQVSQIQQAFSNGGITIAHSDDTTSAPGDGATLQATYPRTITTSNFRSTSGQLVADANTTFTSLWNDATQSNDFPGGGLGATGFAGFSDFKHYGAAFVLDTSVPVYQASSGYYLWKPQNRFTYILSQTTPLNGDTPLPWWIGGNVAGFGTADTPRKGVLISGNWFVNNGKLNTWDSAFNHQISLQNLPQLSASDLSSQFTLALGTGRTVSASDRIEIPASAVVSSTDAEANGLQSISLPNDISRPSMGSATIKGMTSDANGHWQNSNNTLQVGDLIRVEVALNEAVSIVYSDFNTTISEVTLQIGKVTRQAKLNLQASQNTNLLVFDYTVVNGDIDNSAGVEVGAIARNWCVYTDASGNRISFPSLLLNTANNVMVNGSSSLLSQQPISTQGVIYSTDGNTPYKWPASAANSAVTRVTYAFYTSASADHSAPNYLDDTARPTFRPWSEAQKTVLRQIIANLEGFSILSFVEVSDPTQAQIGLGAYDAGRSIGAFAHYPSGAGDIGTPDGDVWINTGLPDWDQPSTDINGTPNYEHFVIVHEFGHALGLQHPRNYNAGSVAAFPDASAVSVPAPFSGYYLDAEQDNEHFTVMSYLSSPYSKYPLNYALYDVAALQFLYGTNTSTRNNDNTYTLDPSNGVLMADGTALPTHCIWDGGGNDTLSLATSTSSTSAVLNLNQGGFCSVGSYAEFVIAYGVDIENAIGGLGADVLVSNTLDNQLTGGDGRDTFVFLPEWGHDIITDFTLHADKIDFSQWLGIRFADLTISQSNLNTLITYQSNSITLNNILSEQLIAGAFVFA